MARVSNIQSKVLPSASADVARSALKEVDVVDSLGRALKVKKMSISDKMRLSKAIGGVNTTNQYYFTICFLACSVVSIDATPVPPPQTEREIEALAERLGEEALDSVGAAYAEHFGVITQDEVRDEVKNS
jgi:hypothetical protein